MLFLWWPKSTVVQRLESEDGPDTLLAVVIALGVSVAYYNIRAGAEEILLPGQHSLREWAIATPLKLGRILSGYLCGHVLQTLHAIVLSSPLLLMGYSVAGGEWSGLVWSLTAVLFQATFYRLVGAVMYMTIGHYDTIMFIAPRVALVVGYGLAGVLFPITSQWLVSSQLLGAGPWLHSSVATAPGLPGFLLVHAALCVLLAWVLYLLLARQRRMSALPVSGDPPEEVRSR